MPQCTSKCHYGIAQSSGKLGVFLHSFSPSIGLHSDPVQREFLVCRRSCCVALVQMLLGAGGRIVLDPCWHTHGLEQQRHTSFNVKFLLKGKESAFLSSKFLVVYKHHGFVSVHEYLLNCFCCSYNAPHTPRGPVCSIQGYFQLSFHCLVRRDFFTVFSEQTA